MLRRLKMHRYGPVRESERLDSLRMEISGRRGLTTSSWLLILSNAFWVIVASALWLRSYGQLIPHAYETDFSK